MGIGNDFLPISYFYKLYLLDALSHSYLPLWSPSEAAGFPFFSSPFTQAFYPLNLFLVAFYKLAGGYSILDHTKFTILGISIFTLGIYFWLKEFKLSTISVIFATLVVSLSFKISDILRFPAAIHTAAWFPWILYFSTRILFSKGKSEAFKYSGGLLIVMVCLLTGGYPYYWYYFIFLIIPYLGFFLLPRTRSTFTGARNAPSLGNYLILGSSALVSILFCSPYLLNMLILLQQTFHRVGGNLAFSTADRFTPLDTIGSLIFPPAANSEGVYYFGLIGVILIGVYLLNNVWETIKSAGKLKVIIQFFPTILLLVWIAVINNITYQDQSPIFMFFWKYLPFFSTLREWGRLTIILLPLMALLLGFALTYFHDSLFQADQYLKRSKQLIISLVVIYLPILGAQIYLLTNREFSTSWKNYFYTFSGKEISFILTGILSFIVLLTIFILSGRFAGSKKAPFVVWSVLFTVCFIDLFIIGSNFWVANYNVIYNRRYQVNILNTFSYTFNYRRIDQVEIPLNAVFSIGTIPNWHFDRYLQFVKNYSHEPEAKKQLLGMVDGNRLYFSKDIAYSSISGYLADSAQFKGIVKVKSYSGEKLVIEINAPQKGYISFIDNWDPNWTALVNGKRRNIELLFGSFKSVFLEEGVSQVIFEYKPVLFPFSYLLSKKPAAH